MERPERPNVNLRVDRALHQRLVAEAKRSERSLNKECIWRLRQSIETPEQPDTD
jgi:predicted HicB family RNase H-like nuclease